MGTAVFHWTWEVQVVSKMKGEKQKNLLDIIHLTDSGLTGIQ